MGALSVLVAGAAVAAALSFLVVAAMGAVLVASRSVDDDLVRPMSHDPAAHLTKDEGSWKPPEWAVPLAPPNPRLWRTK